jgi:type I restriction enzyme M protein
MEELREEHGGEDGLLSNATDDKGKISKAGLTKAIKDLGRRNADNGEEYDKLQEYKALTEQETLIQASIKAARAELEKKVIAQYPKLSIEQIKTIVIEKKWLAAMEARIGTEMENISHRLTRRIKELAERYETPLPQLDNSVAELTAKVADHLKKMGFA